MIFDETLEVSRRAQRALARPGVRLSLACSLHELELAFLESKAAGSQESALVVNLGGEVGAWEVAERVRRKQFKGRIMVLASNPGAPDLEYLRQLPNTDCMARPPSAGMLDHLLAHFVAAAPPLGSDRTFTPTLLGMVGQSQAMQEILGRIKRVAESDANVCIYGESGTGKELIARAIHYTSARRDRPLITLDCAAVPEGLMESQLFGHVKGAFTGAVEHREGVFSLADSGTLFLDELCELPLALQAKLLRVIQAREFFKVGGTTPVRTNVRLITATNKDPGKQAAAGAFREDLYYRVAVAMIKVPSLRERRDDIPLLVEHFLTKFCTVYRKSLRGVAPEVMHRIMTSPWPGNVRQLENFVEQAVVFAEGEWLTERDLPQAEDRAETSGGLASVLMEPGMSLRDVERRYVLHMLQRVQGNRTLAARLLGISVRNLHYKLKAYGEDMKPPSAGGHGMHGGRRDAETAPATPVGRLER